MKRLIEFYRGRPKEEEDNIIVVRALEFYRDNQNILNNKQLELNQKFIDLTQDYLWSLENEKEDFDSKRLMKYIWNKGYALKEKSK